VSSEHAEETYGIRCTLGATATLPTLGVRVGIAAYFASWLIMLFWFLVAALPPPRVQPPPATSGCARSGTRYEVVTNRW
jgi:hypothetical protein